MENHKPKKYLQITFRNGKWSVTIICFKCKHLTTLKPLLDEQSYCCPCCEARYYVEYPDIERTF